MASNPSSSHTLFSIKPTNIFIFHGTEGYPEENWFPWLKQELEKKSHHVFVPQFPSPPVVSAKITEWFEVLRSYDSFIGENTIFVGHSLGGVFALRILEQLHHSIKATFLIGTPIGVRPILNYDRDMGFSGNFDFDWEKIREKSHHFDVFQSDNDPYVSLGNGEKLAECLHTNLSFIPDAGHFNTKAGYTQFVNLYNKIVTILEG